MTCEKSETAEPDDSEMLRMTPWVVDECETMTTKTSTEWSTNRMVLKVSKLSSQTANLRQRSEKGSVLLCDLNTLDGSELSELKC